MCKGNKGVTLVETLLGLLIGGIIITSLWTLYGASHRQRLCADKRLQGVQKVLHFAERFELDGRRLYTDYENPIVISQTKDARIEFSIFAPAGGLERVQYRFCPKVKRIYRRRGDRDWHKIPGYYSDVTFRLIEKPQFLKLPPNVDEFDGLPKSGGLLEYLLTSIPINAVNLSTDQIKKSDHTVLWGTVPLPTWLGKWKHEYWVGTPNF